MISRSFNLIAALVLGCLVAKIDSFVLVVGPHPIQHRQTLSSSTSILHQQVEDDEEDVVVLTPNQIKFLRKEVSKRSARNDVPKVFLEPDETLGPFSDSTLAEIAKGLDETELVEVRSIAKDHKRQVFSTAEMLAATLEMDVMKPDGDGNDRPVVVLSTKGFSAVFYCPMADDANPDKIILRSSYNQRNKWTRKVKAARDHRGQIIRDD